MRFASSVATHPRLTRRSEFLARAASSTRLSKPIADNWRRVARFPSLRISFSRSTSRLSDQTISRSDGPLHPGMTGIGGVRGRSGPLFAGGATAGWSGGAECRNIRLTRQRDSDTRVLRMIGPTLGISGTAGNSCPSSEGRPRPSSPAVNLHATGRRRKPATVSCAPNGGVLKGTRP